LARGSHHKIGHDSHAESTQKGAAMDEQHLVIVDIDAVIREGLTVFEREA
jgi:hypothetical protein